MAKKYIMCTQPKKDFLRGFVLILFVDIVKFAGIFVVEKS
jgi:hypothetical protein